MNYLKYFLQIILLLFSSSVFAAKYSKSIKIGAGNILQGYYFVALDLCNTIKLVDKNCKCEVIVTTGSYENLEMLRSGELDFALVQSNMAREAFEGNGYYADKEKIPTLRQVLNLYDEIFTVIVRRDSDIKIFSDIGGKKISNGPADSVSNVTYDALMKFYKLRHEPIDIDLPYEQYAEKLCNKEVDALMIVTGHPNPFVNLIIDRCDVSFVPIETRKINKLVESNNAYHATSLQRGLYYDVSNDEKTFALSAIVVTNENFDSLFLKKFINKFQEKNEIFKHSHYLLKNLGSDHFIKNFVLPAHKALHNFKI
jgi:TRAP transporter TAXI family solute receptor